MAENTEKTVSCSLVSRDHSFTQNRELSWLDFNERVLEEGMDPRVPVLERAKFISIFTSNLDEFFRVRVGSLINVQSLKKNARDNKTGWTAEEQLNQVFERVPGLYRKRDLAIQTLRPLLEREGIRQLSLKDLSEKEERYLDRYYESRVLPILSPLIIDARHPFPNLVNLQSYIFSDVVDEEGEVFYGLISLPPQLPEMIFFPGTTTYVPLSEVIMDRAESLFKGFTLESRAVISITRSADIDLDEGLDEMEGNIRSIMKKALKKRQHLAPVRLEIQGSLPQESLDFLIRHHHLKTSQVYESKSPLHLKYFFELEDRLTPKMKDRVLYPPFEPQPSPLFDSRRPIMDQILEGDKILHFPYESMDPFLRLLQEAAKDPSVATIRITIYRMASVSKVAKALAEAAENGKEVLALMELRARFDEENNIDYSELLEQAGCTIIYGLENFKVHSKVCQITFFRDNKVQFITQIGTGNYNEKTAKAYTDLSLMTADPVIGRDAGIFFKNMQIGSLTGKYDKLLQAPTGIKPGLMKMMDREIDRAKRGEPAEIILKCNSVSERDVLDKISEASQAGVKVTMIVRGICCILPGIPEKTENLRIISIVGRFLEHHRIYSFGPGHEDLYLSSADLMTRNLVNRVEIACPIQDPLIKKRVAHILDVCLEDTAKAKELQADGSYLSLREKADLDHQAMAEQAEKTEIGAQSTFMKEAEESAREREKEMKKEERKVQGSPAPRAKRERPLEVGRTYDVRKLPEEKKGFWAKINAWFKGE